MWQTLFHVPHADPLWGAPLFGVGWLLLVWALASAALLIWLARKQGFNADTLGHLPVLAVIGAAIVFVLPMLEAVDPFTQKPIGLPIRGYGAMLLLAVVAGVSLGAYQAKRMGVDPEVIFSLAFVVFVTGILGARGLFVAQHWHKYATWREVFDITQGGLVVYGSLLGGAVGALWFARRRQLPILALADLATPGMLLGLAIGRIGCLLNGCCFGGVCDYPWATRFPAGSPPYQHHLAQGWLQGVELGRDPAHPDDPAALPVVTRVDRERLGADNAALAAGARVAAINGTRLGRADAINDSDALDEKNVFDEGGGLADPSRPEGAGEHRARSAAEPVDALRDAWRLLARSGLSVTLETDDGRTFRWSTLAPAKWSLPVHPSQVYASLHALLLCALTWRLYPFRKRDGEVFAALLVLYGVGRFLEEHIRDDDLGLLGSLFTISQWISMVLFACGLALLFFLRRQPEGAAFPPAAATPNAS